MSPSAPKSCLITGGAGYLAHALARQLREKDHRVKRLFRAGGETPFPDPAIQDFTGDVRAFADVEEALEGVDIVFHLAAQTSARVADEDPGADFEANVRPLENILKVCRLRQPETIVLFAGTVTQRGIPGRLPVDESQPDEPASAYDRHKLRAEKMLAEACRDAAVRGATLRLPNLYGPGPAEKGTDRGVLNRMIRQALRGEALTVFGSGEFLRDYLFVEDAARAFVLAAQNIDAVNGRHFVVATGRGRLLAEAARLIAARAEARTGLKVRIESVPAPPTLSPLDFRNFVGDPSAFMRATGWKPGISLEEGVERTFDALEAEP